MIEIGHRKLSVLLIQSFRYCLGRHTYAVSDCVDDLIEWKDILLSSQKGEIINTLKDDYFPHYKHEHDCDVAEWKRLLTELEDINNGA